MVKKGNFSTQNAVFREKNVDFGSKYVVWGLKFEDVVGGLKYVIWGGLEFEDIVGGSKICHTGGLISMISYGGV